MRLTGWKVPAQSLSASSLSLFISCPEQYRLRKIKKIPQGFGMSRFIGNVDHHTHTQNFQQKITSGKDQSVDEMHHEYLMNWNHTLFEEGEPDWEGSEELAVQEHGLKMIDVYRENVSPRLTPLATEARFEERVPGVPVPIVGYIDLETPSMIIDRKTSGKKVTKLKPGWKFQGGIYSMVYDKDVAYHVVTKQVTPQVITEEESEGMLITKGTDDNLVRTLVNASTLLNDMYIKFGPDQPWPTYGTFHDWLCDYCSFGPKHNKNCVAFNPQSPYLNGDPHDKDPQ